MMDNFTANYTNLKPPGEPPQWFFVAIVSALIIACICFNGTIVGVFIIEKSIRSPANMFVLSLACSDLVVGTVSMPLWLADATPGVELHIYAKSVDILCSATSIFNCSLMSLERAVKITYPFWYENNVTKFRIRIIILLAWIAAILVGNLALLRGDDLDNIPFLVSIFVFVYFIPVLVIIVSYTSIFFVARRHARSIRKQSSRITGGSTDTRILEAKTAMRLGIFVAVFIICWTLYFMKEFSWEPIIGGQTPVSLRVVANLLANINSAVNPFLYALLNPAFRKGMAKLYKRRRAMLYYRESSRRNEASTAQTNLNNSSSASRNASTHCSPQTDRRDTLALCGDRVNALKMQYTLPESCQKHTDFNEDQYNAHDCLFETSL